MGPGEVGFGTAERALSESVLLPGERIRGYRVFNLPGFEMTCRTQLPIGGLRRGYMVRHDENYTISRWLATERSRPSVYYVYSPSPAATESVEELRRTGSPQGRFELLTESIREGRDEVGLTMYRRDGTCLWVGSELDIDEARALFDREMDKYVNATINQVMGGYVSGIAWLLLNRQSRSPVTGLVEPEVVSAKLGMKYGSPFWGPVCVCWMDTLAGDNSLESFGMKLGRPYGRVF